MSFEVVVISDAKREIKALIKKYKSSKDDLATLITSLEATPQQGEPLGKDCFKIRLAISAKTRERAAEPG